MGNRILKENICTSDTIDELSWFEEVFFYRLIVNCDDYGRFDGRPAVIKGRLFPLKGVTEKDICKALDKLSAVGLVMPYEYDGKPILQLVTWDEHQSVRNKRSKYPAVDGSDITTASENVRLIKEQNKLKSIEINCIQLKSNEINCSSNPIQSNTIQSESESNTIPAQVHDVDDLFSEFWKEYPRKVAKPVAYKSFVKLNPNRALLDTMLSALKRQKSSRDWLKDGGQFIPHPSTWLNQRRWEDEAGNVEITYTEVTECPY